MGQIMPLLYLVIQHFFLLINRAMPKRKANYKETIRGQATPTTSAYISFSSSSGIKFQTCKPKLRKTLLCQPIYTYVGFSIRMLKLHNPIFMEQIVNMLHQLVKSFFDSGIMNSHLRIILQDNLPESMVPSQSRPTRIL